VPADDLPGAIAHVLDENTAVLWRVDRPSVGRVAAAIATADRLFVAGEGGCGLIARMVALRLMHLGFRSHVLGETTTPPMAERDLLLAFSASGSKGTAMLMAGRAQAIGASVVAVTAEPESPLALVADRVLHVDVAGARSRGAERQPRLPAASLFEQASLLLFDAMACVLAGNLHARPAGDAE
jgi:6-phospho-3-hexuloisomerase